LFTVNHYFSLDVKANINKKTCFLENILDSLTHRVLLLVNFNVPSFDWNCGIHSSNCYYYTKLKGDMIHSDIRFLGLNQYNYIYIQSVNKMQSSLMLKRVEHVLIIVI
jgi:hypothetical protein